MSTNFLTAVFIFLVSYGVHASETPVNNVVFASGNWCPSKTNHTHAPIDGKCSVAYENGYYEKVTSEWSKLALSGHTHAEFNLGQAYWRGHGVEQNFALAYEWYKRAAKKGYAPAQYNLATIYDDGTGVAEDDAKAVRWLRKAADQGLPEAQSHLGVMYDDGTGVAEDDAEAVRWYRKAAEKGYGLAQYNLAAMYEYGAGITQDHLSAIKWYEKAARNGDEDAYWAIGKLFMAGRGVTPNDKTALEWWLKGAEAGCHDCQNWIGIFYLDGRGGLSRDHERALYWYRRAAKNGNSYAENNIGWAYEKGTGVAINYEKAAYWYKRSAQQNNELALNNLGNLYLLGLGVEQSFKKAAELFRKSSDLGELEATVRLGQLYESGKGVEKNLKIALKLYEKASHGNEDYETSVDDKSERHVAKAHFKRLGKAVAKSEKYLKNIQFGKFNAIIFGNNKYKKLKSLTTAVNDATDLHYILKNKYGFRSELILNADRNLTLTKLSQLKDSMTENDNLLIYYAGHGIYDNETNTGFWQPIDADQSNEVNWIPNPTITRIIKSIKAKNILLVSDSCYSGAILRGIKTLDSQKNHTSDENFLKRLTKRKSRIALTSGGNEPVVDSISGGRNSVFANLFLAKLKENQNLMLSSELSVSIKKSFAKNKITLGVNQIPEYSSIYNSGHDGGEFIFLPVSLIEK